MIAFLINELDVRGGTHKQLLELLDYASEQGEAFKVLTKKLDLAGTYPGFAKYADRIIVIRDLPAVRWWKRSPFRQWSYLLYLRKLVGAARCVNIHDSGFDRYLLAFIGKRVVWQINDLPGVFREGVASDSRALRLRDHLEKCRIQIMTWLCVDQITVNVSKNADRVRKHFRAPVSVLYCGITPVGLSHDNAMTFERFKCKRVSLLSSGVFFPYRNYETLVRAVGLLRDRGVEATLNIFGSYQYGQSYYRKVQSVIEELCLTDRVKILGQVDEAQYRKLHEGSDAFCFVNVNQSWGLAVFEAMSAGLPVIVSNSVGATEILRDGIDAVFVDPSDAEVVANAIVRLMNDRNEYGRIQQEGIRLVKRYSWEDAYCRPMMKILTK